MVTTPLNTISRQQKLNIARTTIGILFLFQRRIAVPGDSNNSCGSCCSTNKTCCWKKRPGGRRALWPRQQQRSSIISPVTADLLATTTSIVRWWHFQSVHRERCVLQKRPHSLGCSNTLTQEFLNS